MNDLEKEYAPQATAKSLQLSTHIDTDAPSLLISNRLYVKEILQNFITNAIKYTKEGAYRLRLVDKEILVMWFFPSKTLESEYQKATSKKYFVNSIVQKTTAREKVAALDLVCISQKSWRNYISYI